jgi:hypothetical protein
MKDVKEAHQVHLSFSDATAMLHAVGRVEGVGEVEEASAEDALLAYACVVGLER